MYRSKLKFYNQWLSDMSLEERNGIIGQWVFKNMMRYAIIITEEGQQSIIKKLFGRIIHKEIYGKLN